MILCTRTDRLSFLYGIVYTWWPDLHALYLPSVADCPVNTPIGIVDSSKWTRTNYNLDNIATPRLFVPIINQCAYEDLSSHEHSPVRENNSKTWLAVLTKTVMYWWCSVSSPQLPHLSWNTKSYLETLQSWRIEQLVWGLSYQSLLGVSGFW